MNEYTFVIIKPDAITRRLLGEIISRFERKGLSIREMQMRHKNRVWCRKHYYHILKDNERVFSKLQLFMTGQHLIGIVLFGPAAVKVVRAMVGATNSLHAEPGTIRGDFGSAPVHCNLVHASDSKEQAECEISFFFDPMTDDVPLSKDVI